MHPPTPRPRPNQHHLRRTNTSLSPNHPRHPRSPPRHHRNSHSNSHTNTSRNSKLLHSILSRQHRTITPTKKFRSLPSIKSLPIRNPYTSRQNNNKHQRHSTNSRRTQTSRRHHRRLQQNTKHTMPRTNISPSSPKVLSPNRRPHQSQRLTQNTNRTSPNIIRQQLRQTSLPISPRLITQNKRSHRPSLPTNRRSHIKRSIHNRHRTKIPSQSIQLRPTISRRQPNTKLRLRRLLTPPRLNHLSNLNKSKPTSSQPSNQIHSPRHDLNRLINQALDQASPTLEHPPPTKSNSHNHHPTPSHYYQNKYNQYHNKSTTHPPGTPTHHPATTANFQYIHHTPPHPI